jgi:cell division initiation protein
MKLTPLDIRHKEFRRGMRGYADVEVDEFLDQVADEYERIFKENIDLQERLEALEDKVAGYKRIEETLQKTLVNAQASAEEQKQNATKQAQLILQDAELKARQLVNDAYSERQAIEQGIAKLRNAEEDFRFKFKTMLEGYMRQLQDAAAPAPEADPRADFARQAEAIKLAIARESASPEPEHETDEPLRAAPFAGAEEASGVAPDPTETTMSQSPRPAAEEPEAAAQESVAAAARASVDGDDVPAEPEEARDRIVFGESDDLLADVDTGVNENEFKW